MSSCAFLGLRLLLFLHSARPQLQGMDAAFRSQFILQEGIDHPVACRLHLRLEGIRRDIYSVILARLSNVIHAEDSVSLSRSDRPEMGFPRRATLHGFVMRVQMGIIENLECRRRQSLVDLDRGNGLSACVQGYCDDREIV